MVELDGAGDGSFVGIVCHGAVHFSESEVELDEVGVADELDKAKVDIAGVEDESMVAGVNGALKDKINVEEPKEGTTPIPCTIRSCNGLRGEHAPHKHTSFSFASFV